MTKPLAGPRRTIALACALACTSVLAIASSFPQNTPPGSTNLHASPTGSGSACSAEEPCSVTAAQAKVRTLNGVMRGDIVVNLGDGRYELASTLALTEADSGNNGFKVIYRNAPGASPVISGGTPVTDWTVHDKGRDIWKANVTSSTRFRQLYVNGTRSIRARRPNLEDHRTRGPYYAGTGRMSTDPPTYTFSVEASEVAKLAGLPDVELVLVDHWKNKKVRIAQIAGRSVSFHSPEAGDRVLAHTPQADSPHYYENAYELLDDDGEWYLDTRADVVYYKPRRGETMASATVLVPNLDHLVTITGASPTAMAHDIQISGLSFEYSNMTLPSRIGYANLQAGLKHTASNWPVDGTYYPGAIQLQHARNITIDSNSISRTGAHAIVALDDTRDSLFHRNTINDTSSGGIYLALRNASSSGNRVTYNTVTNGGIEYTDAVGIFLELAPHSVVSHNEVGHYRYTAISAGFDWNGGPTAATNIEIAYNYLHDVVLLHDDGAGVYTLGRIPNMDIHDNYVKSLSGSKYNGGAAIAGIYLDNGSIGKVVRNNVIDSVPLTFYSSNPPNQDNIFENNYSNSGPGDVIPANTVRNTVAVSKTNWPEAALAIINNAGPKAPGPAPTPR